jgi:hypothetical protein
MKLLLATTLASALLTLSSPSVASTRFTCPDERDFLETWNKAVKTAPAIDLSGEAAVAQAEVYKKIWKTGIPNKDLLANQFVLDEVKYDLVVTKGSYVWNPEYLDSYGVVFEKGKSEAIAVIKTDTDRSDFVCDAVVFEDRVTVPSAEFDALTAGNPTDVTVEVNGVRYEHMYVVAPEVAFATNPAGYIVTFVRGE